MPQLTIHQGELVVGHALHEVAVVRDQKQRAGPAIQQVLHHSQHVGVQVVARLVEDEHVGLVQQNQHQGKTALLAAGQVAHRLVEVGTREPQLLQQLRGRHLFAVEHGAATVTADNLAHAIVAEARKVVQMLRQHGEPHGLANLHAPGRGRLQALNHTQQRGFARTVFTHNAIAVTRADDPVHIIEHRSLASVEAHGDVLQVHHLLAEPRHGHTLQGQLIAQRRHVGNERLGGSHVKLRLRRARPRPAREPRQLAAQFVLALLLGKRCQPVALHALHDVGREAAFERLHRAVMHLPHAQTYLVEEPAVVRDHQQRALSRAPAVLQVPRQPGDGTHVQVVRRLVKRKHIPVADEQSHQVNTPTLPARKRAHTRVPRNVARKPRNDVANARITRPLVFGQITHDGFAHRGLRVKRVGLPQHAHAHGAIAQHAAVIRLKRPRQQRKQRRLPVAIAPHDTNAVALIHAERHPLEHRLRRELHPHLLATQQKRHAHPSFIRRCSQAIITQATTPRPRSTRRPRPQANPHHHNKRAERKTAPAADFLSRVVRLPSTAPISLPYPR